MSKLAEHIRELASRRDPPYSPITSMPDEMREKIRANLGAVEHYEGAQLRELILAEPENAEFKKALMCSVASPEYAGVDAFSRKVCEWQDWDVPWSLIMAIARQTWDEARHANFATQVLEHYGGELNDYPDTFAGGVQQTNGQAPAVMEQAFNQPATMLSMVNVSLEGRGLVFFEEIAKLGHRIGDELLERCYDYNWADELTHVTIGDYFVKVLCADDPDAEQRALRAHGFFEYMTLQRSALSEDQTEELKEFFAEEIGRAHAAFAAGTGQQN